MDVQEAVKIRNKMLELLGSELYERLKDGFFCWRGIKPEDTDKMEGRVFKELIQSIEANSQAKRTITQRKVIILKDGT